MQVTLPRSPLDTHAHSRRSVCLLRLEASPDVQRVDSGYLRNSGLFLVIISLCLNVLEREGVGISSWNDIRDSYIYIYIYILYIYILIYIYILKCTVYIYINIHIYSEA